MFPPFSLARRGYRFGVPRSGEACPVHLSTCFPCARDGVLVRRKIHTAHRAGVNVPLVEEFSLKGLRAVGRCEEIDITVYGFSCRAVEGKNISAAVSKHLHTAATASACCLRPSFSFLSERIAVVA